MYEDIAEIEVWYPNTKAELPLKVVPDWDEQVRHAVAVCRLIDRHLDDEARSRGLSESRRFSLLDLCPEERVQMITDSYAVTG